MFKEPQPNNSRILSSGHRTYTNINHVPGHKANNEFKRTEFIQGVFSNHNEINNKLITGKTIHAWKINNTLLSDPWVKEEVSREILKIHKTELK